MSTPIPLEVCGTLVRLAVRAENASLGALDDKAREHVKALFELAAAALGIDAGHVNHLLSTISTSDYHAELLRRLNEGTLSALDHERDLRPIESR